MFDPLIFFSHHFFGAQKTNFYFSFVRSSVSPSVRPSIRSFVLACVRPCFLPCFLPSFLPSFLVSSFLPSFLPSFHHSFLFIHQNCQRILKIFTSALDCCFICAAESLNLIFRTIGNQNDQVHIYNLHIVVKSRNQGKYL